MSDVCRCVVSESPLAPRRCGRPVEVVRHYRTHISNGIVRQPESWALCKTCDDAHPLLKSARSSPIVRVEVGSELHLSMEVAFHALTPP